MNSGDTSDDDVDKPVTETTEAANKKTSLLVSHENRNTDQCNLNCKDNTVISDETKTTETHELETHDSSITYEVLQISDCEPALTSDGNLSNDNISTTVDSIYEISPTRNDNSIEDFLMSVEEHNVPELRWNWETHFLNVPQITITTDANNHRDRNSADEVELNAVVNTLTLYNINEERTDETSTHTEVNETQLVPRSSISDYSNQYSNRELVPNQGLFNSGYDENHSFVPSFLYNHPRSQQLFNNLGVIYIPELNIYRNSMLNALANENSLMEELYVANRRLNVIHDQQMLDAHNNRPSNAIEDVEEMNPIDNIEAVHPDNLLFTQDEVPIQPRPQPRQLPFQQLILIANGGITPLNGQHNALIRLVQFNPSLVFLNIRNIILIIHPRILVGGENNVVFGQNLHWVSIRELLRMNSVMLTYETRSSNNGNQDLNREAGPSNERNR